MFIVINMIRNKNEIIINEDESKKCNICNKIFVSSRKVTCHVKKEHKLNFKQYILTSYYNNTDPICLKTGKLLTFKPNKFGPWFSNFSKNNFPRKPHTDKTKQKIKLGCEKTSMKKFGVKNVFETDWCKEKIKSKMVEKYGVDNIMKTNEMRNLFSSFVKSDNTIIKTKNTNIEKYGYPTFTCTEENRLKLRNYNYRKFYKNWNEYSNLLKEKQMTCLNGSDCINELKPFKFACNVCNFEWNDTLLIPFCKNCEQKFENARSIEESSLMKWLKTEIDIDFKPNKRFNINGKIYEGDVCFDSIKVILELNGLYWHSEKAGKDKNYHINKLKSLESLGYRVFQIFEDEWLFKTNLVKNKILHKLNKNVLLPKIFARKCCIKKISNLESNVFLEKTHIQGEVNASYCYGAYFNNELVSVMTFSSPRINMGNKIKKDREYELVRFSTSDKYKVVGIAGKLLQFFINEIKPVKIISYADRRWTNKSNNLYSKLGFILISETSPNYWYVKKYKREYRFNFTKKKLIKMGYDSNKTEKEIMKELGYDRIWDCGHLKYEMSFD